MVWSLTFSMEKGENMENRLDILTSVDVLNTLHGGISEPQILLNQLEQAREMRIKVPSINPDSIEVEVNNNTLNVFYFLNISSSGKNLRLPYTIYNRTLPYFIEISKINSSIEGEELVITLPFNALAHGYHRKIKTSED